MMAATTNPPAFQFFQTSKLIIPYQSRVNDFPVVGEPVLFNGRKLGDLVIAYVESSLINTAKYMPYEDRVHLDPAFETVMNEYFDELVVISQTNPSLSIVCADRFFEYSCRRYWELIVNQGSKNLAVCLLEEICKCADKWEKKRKQRIHKGTPYYFLTYSYREMGDIDSAFAAAFKAINEDKLSSQPIFGDNRYKQSPAFKYITIVDEKSNYLYETVIKLRVLLNEYIKAYQALNPNFSITDIDNKFLQNTNRDLQEIAFIFVYSLELIKKYRDQLHTLPSNDFYKTKNLNNLFNLCLVVDKILEHKFKRKYKRYTGRNDIYISDGIILLFEQKGWIPTLTGRARTQPRTIIKQTNPPISSELADYVKELALSPVATMTFTGSGAAVPVNSQMRDLLLAYMLRNEAAHTLKKQTTLVTKYDQIIKHLMIAIFTAIDSL